LTGDEWIVEDINRQGIIDASRITLQFDESGRLHGRASCNQYTTTYELTEQIDIGQAITTRKACAPALMNQEQRFLTLLADVIQIDFDEKGALLLSTADGSTLTARR
jgi:heat shock protein HslJ